MNTVSPSWTSRGTSGAEALRRAGCAVLIALCAGLAAFAPATLGATDAAAIFLLARSVVKVEAVDAGGRYFLGTGIIVRRDRVVTACHVTRPARRITVLYGGLRHPVARQRADAVHDVCVLDVPALDAVPVPVGRSGSLSVGDAVIAVGFTGGGGLTPATGVVEGLFCHDGAKVILTDAGFSSGASGGGLFDADGRLVGLLMFRMRAPGAQFSPYRPNGSRRVPRPTMASRLSGRRWGPVLSGANRAMHFPISCRRIRWRASSAGMT